MIHLRRALLSGLLLLTAVCSWADTIPSCQKTFSIQPVALADALQAAYSGNPQVLASRQDLEKSHAQVVGALTGFLPSANISLQAEQYTSYRAGGVPVTVGSTTVGGQQSAYSNYPAFNLSWNLFAGGKDVAAYRGSQAAVRASEGDLDQQTNVTLTGVIVAYADLLKAQAASSLLQRTIELQNQILGRTEQRFRQGKDSLVSVNQARMAVNQSERDYFAGCKVQTDKSAALAQAVGLRPNPFQLFWAASVLPVAPSVSTPLSDFDALIDQDPSVRAAQEKVEVAAKKVDQAKAVFKPTVALVGRYDALGQNPSNFVDAFHETGRLGYRVGFVLQQSLGPFTSEYANLESAKADLIKAELAYESAKIDADGRLRSAWNAKWQTGLALEAAERSMSQARDVLELTRQNQVQGRVGLDTVDQARIAVEKEQEAVEERRLEDRIQAWLLDRALNPKVFVERVLERTGVVRPMEQRVAQE